MIWLLMFLGVALPSALLGIAVHPILGGFLALTGWATVAAGRVKTAKTSHHHSAP